MINCSAIASPPLEEKRVVAQGLGLPEELLLMIFELLDSQSLARSSQVCHEWKKAIDDSLLITKRLWFAKFVYSVIPIHEVKSSIQQFVLPSKGLVLERDVKDALVKQSTLDRENLTAEMQMKQVVMNMQLNNLSGARFCIEQIDLPLLGEHFQDILYYQEVISDKEEFITLFIQTCIQAKCEPQFFVDLINHIEYPSIKLESLTLLAIHFNLLIDYPRLQELTAKCLELNTQLLDLELSDEDLTNQQQIEFYFKALLATHDLRNKRNKQAEAFLKSQMDFSQSEERFTFGFLRTLGELDRFDLVEHLLEQAHIQQDLFNDYFPPDLHILYIKIRNGRSLNDPTINFKKQDLESISRVLLTLIEKEIEIENALTMIEEIQDRLPACLLADFAVHLKKIGRVRRGRELAEMSIQKLWPLVDDFENDVPSINYAFMVLEALVPSFPDMVMTFYTEIEQDSGLMLHINNHGNSEVLEQFYIAAGRYHEARDRISEMINRTLSVRPRAINKDEYYADVFEAYYKSLD